MLTQQSLFQTSRLIGRKGRNDFEEGRNNFDELQLITIIVSALFQALQASLSFFPIFKVVLEFIFLLKFVLTLKSFFIVSPLNQHIICADSKIILHQGKNLELFEKRLWKVIVNQ